MVGTLGYNRNCTVASNALRTLRIETPIGLYLVKACDRGLHGLGLADNVVTNNENLTYSQSQLNSKTVRVVSVSSDKIGSVQHDDLDSKNLFLNQVVEWLRRYFVDPKTLPDLPPVCLPVDGSTEFERKVWTTLAERTGFGKTISYAGLAAEIDNPKASRAVGTALKKNPIGLVIPCHRVIRSDGSAGNYSGGTRNSVKEWLLNHENKSQ